MNQSAKDTSGATDPILPPGKVLVIQTAFIGDVILATSLLETLHRHFPGIRPDILVRKGNETLFQAHPYIGEVLVWDKKGGKYKHLWFLLKQIRKKKYDTVINLQRYGATGFLTTFSGSGERIGFAKNPFAFAFSRKVSHHFGPGIHEIDRNHLLIQHLVRSTPLPPRLYPSAADYERVAAFQEKPYICIAPASVWYTKQFPAAQWIRFLELVPAHYTVYLVGAAGDRPLAETILSGSRHPGLSDLCGELTFLQVAALFGKAVMNYVNDSAPMHLCSAVNAPVCAVYCSTIPEFGYGPLSDKAFIIQTSEALRCRPCGIHGHRACPEGHFRCALGIPAAELAALL